MRNVFLFLRRYRTFLTFLLLQGAALWFLVSYNQFHRAKFLGVANEVTGKINAQYNRLEDYFSLKEENRVLHRFNDSLMNLLPGNFSRHDSSVNFVQDSIPYDTAGHYRRYLSRTATVIYNTVNSQKNFIQVNRGSNQGIKDNMAVISSAGAVVGVVVNTSPNFAQVMSLLHVQNSVSASLKRSAEFGTVEWDGKDPRYLKLVKIPKTVEVKMGDTVITSSVSFNYPPGYMIGTVADIKLDNTTGMYQLRIKTAANFFKLQQVFLLENTDYAEQTRLNQETEKKMETTFKNPR
jgi:rod shape-determining protein MreC